MRQVNGSVHLTTNSEGVSARIIFGADNKDPVSLSNLRSSKPPHFFISPKHFQSSPVQVTKVRSLKIMFKSLVLKAASSTQKEVFSLAHFNQQQRGLHSRNKMAMEYIAKGWNALKEFSVNYNYCAQNEGVDTDQQAFYYLEKAADQLHPGALYLLGAVYLTGDCVKKDTVYALWCFHRASEKGHAGAAIACGSLLMRAGATTIVEEEADPPVFHPTRTALNRNREREQKRLIVDYFVDDAVYEVELLKNVFVAVDS
ncbi:hypothetical protein SSX86_023768 [Deinandra increscens subsp. villosa]|uniref:Uncharacterized protein n=1 Tax=Deinandra increscens subsp. villosa TaxID=3103831 RepID=A0AAP0GTW3_9ASTR